MPEINLNIDGLDKLLKALKAKPPVARVGILGGKNQRTETGHGQAGQTNAEIGASHEFGTSKLPQRSFLRIPISDNLQKYMEQSGALDKETLKAVVASGTVVPWVKTVAVLAERIVADAFDSGGFGKWRPSNMAHKKVQQTLIESQQLRNSITSEVAENG